MLLAVAAVIGGFIVLVLGADRFVEGAAATASNLGLSPLLIGLVIVGFGTSAPELLVSITAAWQGNPGIAVGNAIGSNIANIALVLGITAVVAPLAVHSRIVRQEIPLLLLATAGVYLLLRDQLLERIDGSIMLLALCALMGWMVHVALRQRDSDALQVEFEQEIRPDMPLGRALLWTLVGLVALLLSSRLLVWGAVVLAQRIGVSDLVIGLTVVAVGTSLPELAAALASARKGELDIAIGNVIGSNMFNLLAVLGIPALIAPGATPQGVISRDYPVMAALTVAMLLMAYGFRGRPGRINRVEGAILLAAFTGYQAYLYASHS